VLRKLRLGKPGRTAKQAKAVPPKRSEGGRTRVEELCVPPVSARSKHTSLYTERLRLRCYEITDLPELVSLAGDWQVAQWLGTLPHPYDEGAGREWIGLVKADHASGQPCRFAVALKQSNKLIGGIGLDRDDGGSGTAELGYWLGRQYWRQGYGREAAAAMIDHGFNGLRLDTITAFTDPCNAASQQVLRACGLTPAGEVELESPTRHCGAVRATSFRTTRRTAT
jgi:ribosomal-protein-alanine N-acetyltransferase